MVLKCLDLRVIHYGGRISTECPNHMAMNCPNFNMNLNYFTTTNVQFLINSNLTVKDISFVYDMFSSSENDYTRNNLLYFSIFSDSYCYPRLFGAVYKIDK